MKVYYNEFDKKKCAALSQLMKDGHISKGEIDDRSIKEVQAEEVKDFERCHFFAGIGLWDYSLQLAGWKEGDRVWTGSCPCQPFSPAGRQDGKKDPRHLWPEWERLIKKCKPPVIFGEQVATAIAKGWLDDVYKGLEEEEYALGSIILPASAIGAPHRRERLWFVADSQSEGGRRRGNITEEKRVGEGDVSQSDGSSGTSSVVNSECDGQSSTAIPRSGKKTIRRKSKRKDNTCNSERASASRELSESPVGNSEREGLEGHSRPEHRGNEPRREQEDTGGSTWETGTYIYCPDGKQRIIEPRIPLLADGYPERVGLIHCAGDAIVPQVAAEFIQSYLEL